MVNGGFDTPSRQAQLTYSGFHDSLFSGIIAIE